MQMLITQCRAAALSLCVLMPMATTVNAEVTVVDDTVITTEFGSPYVTLNVSNGYGVSDVCAAGFAAGASWGVCYNQFVPINQAAGNPMYMGPDGFYRLYANQNYIGPQPIVVNTPTEAAALVRLGDLLERATPDELAQLREAVGQTNGNLAELAGRLDAFEERLVAVETTNGEQNQRLDAVETTNGDQNQRLDGIDSTNGDQNQRLDGIDAFVDPLQLELGNQTLDEFVTARIPVAETVMVDKSWPTRFWVLLVIGLMTLAAILWLLLSKKKRKEKAEEEQYAKQSNLKALNGKVEDEATKLTALDEKVAQLGPRLDHTEVVAGTALTLASPLRFTDTSDLSSLNTGLMSTWTAVDSKTKLHYVIPFTKNDDGLLEAPILRRADQDDYIQPFKFQSVKKTEERIRLAHADGRLVKCLKNKAAA